MNKIKILKSINFFAYMSIFYVFAKHIAIFKALIPEVVDFYIIFFITMFAFTVLSDFFNYILSKTILVFLIKVALTVLSSVFLGNVLEAVYLIFFEKYFLEVNYTKEYLRTFYIQTQGSFVMLYYYTFYIISYPKLSKAFGSMSILEKLYFIITSIFSIICLFFFLFMALDNISELTIIFCYPSRCS